MASVVEALDKLVEAVDKASAAVEPGATPAARDAIDEALERPARETRVVSLAESPVMQSFRQELSDGLIRIDTLNQVLRMLTLITERWPAG